MNNEVETNEVLEFIQRRFAEDCDWVMGNCYYFALILKDRFPEGKIFYDVRLGHFVYKYGEKYYPWLGIYEGNEDYLIPWDVFEIYDAAQKQRIIRDCIL